ncbi:MAG: class I SAM-dependent methyltransferase, partial [Anaerolineae bacterium]
MERATEYFAYLARLGLTKHIGSMDATRRLIELCHIGRGDLVLDVGTGVGATPSYLARELDCRVVGVDLLEPMIQQARERARMDGVAGPV